MFFVIDHAAVVYSGELSQTTQYVIEHYGKKLDEAIRSGVRIAYADARSLWNEFGGTVLGTVEPDLWDPADEGELD
jgi:hypothetical protein